MAKRSLRLSPTGIRKAKQQFAAKGWTQEYLAIEVGIKTRQPIWRFFGGEPIERFTFFEICTLLELDWREIALDPPAESIDLTADRPELDDQSNDQVNSLSLDELVQRVRSQRYEKINHQCGTLQLLHIGRPVALEQIYVELDILEQVPSQRFLDFATLSNLTPEEVDLPGLGLSTGNQITGAQAVETYGKVRILGKTGIGKTTLLKYLAMECNHGRFAAQLVPVFITLRDFANSYEKGHNADLWEFIHQEFLTSDIPQPEILHKLLNGGRILFLIDGMDELNPEQGITSLNEIRQFAERYYQNKFVISRRTAFQKLAIQGFTDLEIASLTQPQIKAFVQKWFREFSQTTPNDGVTKAAKFMDMLEMPEKRRFKRLAMTPLFLHLACSLFQTQNKPWIKKADFYKEIVYLLYQKWDEFKGINRTELYPGLLVPQMLDSSCELAFSLFENQQFLYTPEIVGQHLLNFMQRFLPPDTEAEEHYHAMETLLQSAKSQPYGFVAERARDIFSFSYLALHEYLVARKVVVSYELQESEEFLEKLVQHITYPHWREIFLLTATMLQSSDRLVELMKQEIDDLVAEDPYLQDFLVQAHQKLQDKTLEADLTNLEEPSIPSTSPDLGFNKLLQQLGHLSHLLPDSNQGKIHQSTQAIATYQEIINTWEFTPSQQLVLRRYYDANQLLIDCLNNSCAVTASLREEIETNLLLP